MGRDGREIFKMPFSQLWRLASLLSPWLRKVSHSGFTADPTIGRARRVIGACSARDRWLGNACRSRSAG